MALDSMKEIFERSARENIPFWEIVLQYDMEERQVSRQASMAKMLSILLTTIAPPPMDAA